MGPAVVASVERLHVVVAGPFVAGREGAEEVGRVHPVHQPAAA